MEFRVGQIWINKKYTFRLRVVEVSEIGMKYTDCSERDGMIYRHTDGAELLSRGYRLDESSIVTSILALYGI